MELVSEVMRRVHDRYEEIFATRYYPSYGGTGFTERNLTYCFCSQFEKMLAEQKMKPIVWQEAPIKKGKETRDHLDSLILVGDTAYLVEAKRLNMKKKVDSICEDIKRLKQIVQGSIKVNGLENVKHFIVVALIDIWVPHKGKSRKTKLDMHSEFGSNCVEQGLSLCFEKQVKSLEENVESEEYRLICYAGKFTNKK